MAARPRLNTTACLCGQGLPIGLPERIKVFNEHVRTQGTACCTPVPQCAVWLRGCLTWRAFKSTNPLMFYPSARCERPAPSWPAAARGPAPGLVR